MSGISSINTYVTDITPKLYSHDSPFNHDFAHPSSPFNIDFSQINKPNNDEQLPKEIDENNDQQNFQLDPDPGNPI